MVSETWSYLEYGVPARLTDRLLVLVKLLYDGGEIDEERLRSELGLPAVENGDEESEEASDEVEDGNEAEIDEMLAMIEGVRDPSYWSNGSNKMERLKSGVRMLVDEVEASDAGG